ALCVDPLVYRDIVVLCAGNQIANRALRDADNRLLQEAAFDDLARIKAQGNGTRDQRRVADLADLPTFRCPERKLRDGGDLLAVSTLEQARPVVETRARIDADLPACLRAGRERVRDELVELSGDVHAGVRELIVDNQLVIPVTADD